MTATPRDAKPEIDDSQNPTAASPASTPLEGEGSVGAGSPAAGGLRSGSEDESMAGEPEPRSGRNRGGVQLGGAQMIGQLQAMIEDLSHQAAPVVRRAAPVLLDIAAKAAELAAIAAERAGPLAKRAADVTQDVGVRVAARSREVASDLRRAEQRDSTSESNRTALGSGADRAGVSEPIRPPEGTQRPPTTPGL